MEPSITCSFFAVFPSERLYCRSSEENQVPLLNRSFILNFVENQKDPSEILAKMFPEARKFQIFVQSPELQIPTQSLTFDNPSPNFTVGDLKFALLSRIHQAQSFIAQSYFTCNGKPLSDSAKLQNFQIGPLSTLTLRCRLLGGGGDGGATGAESRDCYLNMYAVKKPDKVDPNEMRLSKWFNCKLSHERLKKPVVIDKLGNLFNKEALVEALLKKSLPKEISYIKGLKDMIPVELSVIPGLDEGKGTEDGVTFECPVSGFEFNGKYKFFALKPCGHVLSAKALKEVKSSQCLVCHKEFSESDKIVINGDEGEVAVLRERMLEEREKVKEKRGKKVKNGDVRMHTEEERSIELHQLSGKKHGINNKVMDKALGNVEGNLKVKGNGKVESNVPVKRFKAVDIVPPNATKEVYASIFTSSKKSGFKETYSCRSLPLGRN